MNAETIKDFLASLGFEIDEADSRKLVVILTETTDQVLKLGAAVGEAALSVVAYTAKIASGLDSLYWTSQRTGATVTGIQQIGYAASQVGGSVEAAKSALESLARFMRSSPGAEGFLNRLGVQTRDAGGNLRDMADIFTSVGQKLSNMPNDRANQYAQMLGIDENTLMAMRRGMGQFSAQYSQMKQAIGYNPDEAAVSSNKFMTSLRGFDQMVDMIQGQTGAILAEGLSGSLDKLRKQILDNFPKIESTITASVKGILWFTDAIGSVVYRLIQAASDISDWWNTLDNSTQQLIELFGGLIIAWRLLNSAFLMSPIGIITALGLAIFGLYDDYKAWDEGGQSLINWKEWEPGIKSALIGIGMITDSVKSLALETATLFGIDPKAWSLKWEFNNLTHNLGELGKMLTMIGDLLNALNEGRWSDAASIAKQLLKQGSDQPDAMPGVTANATNTRNWLIDKYRKANSVVNSFLPEWAGGSSGNLPDRNNNPGNLRPVSGGGFRSFDTALEGWAAMRNQLIRYFTGKTTGKALKSITDIVSTWAPSSENDTGKYINDISKWMGGAPDAALNLSDPQVMTSMMQSIAREEGFSAWNSPLAAQAAGATVNQQTTINIHGVNDPQRAGMEVADRQTDVNSRITQLATAGPR